MIVQTIRYLGLSCVLLGSVAGLYAAQEKQDRDALAAPVNSTSGAELYAKHCAACHGNDLKGSGPVPDPFKKPPDLTTLTRRHGGKFPAAYVADVLRNGVIMSEHGPAEMPIWGADFSVGQRLNESQVTLRITNLTNYIKARQAK